MKQDCLKIVAVIAVIGTVGSLIGWYWSELVDCWGQSLQNVKFGPALLWIVIASLFVRAFNKFVIKG